MSEAQIYYLVLPVIMLGLGGLVVLWGRYTNPPAWRMKPPPGTARRRDDRPGQGSGDANPG